STKYQAPWTFVSLRFRASTPLLRTFLRPVFRRGVVISRDGIRQLTWRNGGSAALHHDEAAGVIREPRRFVERCAGRERETERRDDGIARARHVGYFVRAENRDVRGRLPRLEQRHAAAAPRDEHRPHPRAPQQHTTRPLERPPIVLQAAAECMFHFRLIRRARGETAVREQSIPRVDQNRNAATASTAVDRAT